MGRAFEAEATPLHEGSGSGNSLGILEIERKWIGLELTEPGEWIAVTVESWEGPDRGGPSGRGRGLGFILSAAGSL